MMQQPGMAVGGMAGGVAVGGVVSGMGGPGYGAPGTVGPGGAALQRQGTSGLRRTGTAHRHIDSGMSVEGAGGVESRQRRRKREREEALVGFEYGPAISVSEANFEVAGMVFDLLDKDKSGLLDSTDFVNAGTVDREVFHRALRPIPRSGFDFHEFVRRCAKFCCGGVNADGSVLFPASKGPQTLTMQLVPVMKLLELAQQRMNEELHQFFDQWRLSLERSSGVAVATIYVAPENMVMMCRVYNRLDMSYGDGDGILSANDRCWSILQQNGFIQNAQQTALTFEQFREALVTRALDSVPFVLDRPGFTMDAAVGFVTQKLNEAVMALLGAPGTGLAANLTSCPSLAQAPQGLCPELDHPPLQAPQPLSTHAFNLQLDQDMLHDLTLLYKDLDEDESGSLEAEDFQNGAAMEELWMQIRNLDADGDGQISIDEFIRGFGAHALSRMAEFNLQEFMRDCTLRTFVTGKLDIDGNVVPDPAYPRRKSLSEVINERCRGMYQTIRPMVPLRHGVSTDARPL